MVFSKTMNSGENWNRYILANMGFGIAIAIAPSNSNIVYAGGQPSMTQPWFFKTTNSGTSWDTLSTLSGQSVVHCLAIDPNNPNIVFAGKPDGVFKSTNGGNTWINTGLSDVSSIIIVPNAPDTVYAGTASGVYISTSGGGNWTEMNHGFAYPVVTDLGIDPDDYLYAGTYGAGMYRWSQQSVIEQEKQSENRSIISALPNPTNNRVSINYQITKETPVNLCIYDIQGRLVKRLISEVKGPGTHSAVWNGLDDKNNQTSAGIYFYKFSTREAFIIKKLVVLK